MPGTSAVAADVKAAISPVADWLRDPQVPKPDRAQLAAAVRATARAVAAFAPGKSVELRIPPYVAVQCVEGPRHTRGTPPNVAETDPRTWLLLATGLLSYAEATESGVLIASGTRASEIARWLPIVRLSSSA
jgi:hypothetical protein